jgi:hypothetical protein
MNSSLCILAVVAGLSMFAGDRLHATTITDPAGDFLTGFPVAQRNVDLDVVSASATFGSESIFLSAQMAGAIRPAGNELYVWGVNRGGATDILAHLPNPVGVDVAFNAIVVLLPDGSGFVVEVNPDGSPAKPPRPLPTGAVTIVGDTIRAEVPLDFLPSTGAEIGDYGFNLWPRIDGISANDQVSDFGPDDGRGADSTFRASAVPEPASLTLMAAGLGLALCLRRRSKGQG